MIFEKSFKFNFSNIKYRWIGREVPTPNPDLAKITVLPCKIENVTSFIGGPSLLIVKPTLLLSSR